MTKDHKSKSWLSGYCNQHFFFFFFLINRLLIVSFQQLYSIHLSEQDEDCTMQLADHIRVRTPTPLKKSLKKKPNKQTLRAISFLLLTAPALVRRSSRRARWTACGWRRAACGPSCTPARRRPSWPCSSRTWRRPAGTCGSSARRSAAACPAPTRPASPRRSPSARR